MGCPKCGATLLGKNEDGDLECLCGKIVYKSTEPAGQTASPAKMKQAGEAGQSVTTTITLEYALNLLKEDSIKAFIREFEKALHPKGNRPAFDVFIEVLSERSQLENISKGLLHWKKYLSKLPGSLDIRGAMMVLSILVDICKQINKMEPPEIG